MTRATEQRITWAVMAIVVAFLAYRLLPSQLSWPVAPGGGGFPAELRPLVSELEAAMPGEAKQRDARALAGFCHGCAKLLANDGRSDLYLVQDGVGLKERMLMIGEAVVGPDWVVGERYPQIPGLIASHVGEVDLQSSRADAVKRFEELGKCFWLIAN